MTTTTGHCEASADCPHLKCVHCDKLIRTGSALARNHPGTVQGTISDQQCGPCYKRGGPPPPPRPDKCVECDQPFTWPSTPVPGGVPHAGRSMCRACYGERVRQREGYTAYHREAQRLSRALQYEQQRDLTDSETIDRAFDYSDITYIRDADLPAYHFTVRRRLRIAKRIALYRKDWDLLNQLSQKQRMEGL